MYRPARGPWPMFKGTWAFPKKITRQVANELTATPQYKIDSWKNRCNKLEKKLAKRQPIKGKKPSSEVKDETDSKDADVTVEDDIEAPADLDHAAVTTSVVPYVPGDLTRPKYRPDSYHELIKYRFRKDKYRDDAAVLKGFPKSREDFSRPIETEPPDSKTVTEEFCNKTKEMMNAEYHPCLCERRSEKKPSAPLVSTMKNFDMARKLHKLNLEHRPLPDTIADALYRKYQMDKNKEPGLALKDGNYASGVAWKTYAGFGPTRCTKLRVFRPKTSITNKIKDSVNDRPSSVNSFDKKWRFIRQRKVSPMQLAVCWDLTPMDPNDEPKRTPHIDGSNGSQAPAVFSLVHSPKPKFDQDLEDLEEPEVNERPKTCASSLSSTKTQEFERIRSAYNYYKSFPKEDEAKCCSADCYKRKTKKREVNQRLCVACELKNINLKDTKPKSEFKLAFKAGVPQKVSNFINYCCRNVCKVPKMKNPYRIRNYAINSLAPPFSLQNYKRHDYPEHWRLASVYQHSYKPVHARKKPLIQTVFK